MSNTPVVFVEGHDDIQFYSKVAQLARKEITVEAVENVEGYQAGCDWVIRCISDLQDLIAEKRDNVNFVLGIIDRDVRYYRDDVPDLTGLFILKNYSFESHFVTHYVLKQLISDVTYVHGSLISTQTLGYVELGIRYEELYYVSLEALKNACVKDYYSLVSYEDNAGNIFNHHTKLSEVLSKKDELDQFACDWGITREHINLVAKGKWLLHIYCEGILKQIRTLSKSCSSGLIDTCNYCCVGSFEKCLWRTKINYQLGQLQRMILNYIDENEVGYIQERLLLLA